LYEKCIFDDELERQQNAQCSFTLIVALNIYRPNATNVRFGMGYFWYNTATPVMGGIHDERADKGSSSPDEGR
jgi:hypothetical protein